MSSWNGGGDNIIDCGLFLSSDARTRREIDGRPVNNTLRLVLRKLVDHPGLRSTPPRSDHMCGHGRRICSALKGAVGGIIFTASMLYVAVDITFSEAFAVYYSVIFFAVGLTLCAIDLRRAFGGRGGRNLLQQFSTLIILASGMTCLGIRTALSKLFALEPEQPLAVLADVAGGATGSVG